MGGGGLLNFLFCSKPSLGVDDHQCHLRQHQCKCPGPPLKLACGNLTQRYPVNHPFAGHQLHTEPPPPPPVCMCDYGYGHVRCGNLLGLTGNCAKCLFGPNDYDGGGWELPTVWIIHVFYECPEAPMPQARLGVAPGFLLPCSNAGWWRAIIRSSPRSKVHMRM